MKFIYCLLQFFAITILIFSSVWILSAYSQTTQGIEFGGMFIVKDGRAYIKGNTSIDGSISTDQVTDSSNEYKHCSFLYIVDRNVSDQGDDEDGSIKHLLNFIGPQKSTFILQSEGVNANYNFRTSIEIPKNIFLRIENGAILNVDPNVIVSFHSPANIIAGEKQTIKAGSGIIKFNKEGKIYPGWWGISSIAFTDYTTLWNEINESMANNSIISLFPNSNYFLDTHGGIIFSKTVHLKGNGAFFMSGPGVGNSPLITICADNSILENFSIDYTFNHFDVDGNNNFQDPNDTFEKNHRKGILVTGDFVECCNLYFLNCPTAMSYETLTGGSIHHCEFINNIIVGGSLLANNFHAALRLAGATGTIVSNNYFEGHGQGILIGEKGSVGNITISENTFKNQSNNGTYISSGNCCNIFLNYYEGFDGSAIKTRGDGHDVSKNRIVGTQNIAIAGISVTGNGQPNSSGFNADTCYIRDNKIKGKIVNAILVAKQDGGSLRSVIVSDNNIAFDPNFQEDKRGIVFLRCSSHGSNIEGNMIRHQQYGILFTVDDVDTEFHENCIITDNIASDSTRDNFAFQNLVRSSVSNNQIFNAGSNAACITLSKSSYNRLFHNDLSEYRIPKEQSYSIEAFDGSNYNSYYYNEIWNMDKKTAYHGLGNKSTVVY